MASSDERKAAPLALGLSPRSRGAIALGDEGGRVEDPVFEAMLEEEAARWRTLLDRLAE